MRPLRIALLLSAFALGACNNAPAPDSADPAMSAPKRARFAQARNGPGPRTQPPRDNLGGPSEPEPLSLAQDQLTEASTGEDPRTLPEASAELGDESPEPAAADLRQVDPLYPTTYHIAQESRYSCAGYYGRDAAGNRIHYDGSERRHVRDPQGNTLATVCGRFYAALKMEGTGQLAGDGAPFVVNWAGNSRFSRVGNCVYGKGVGGRCLVPYHTLAAHLPKHPAGTLIYIPRVRREVTLPDGRKHSGFFEVRDTGGAFAAADHRDRIDMFVAYESDEHNIFADRGFTHRRGEVAYVVSGPSAERARAFLRGRFPSLFQ